MTETVTWVNRSMLGWLPVVAVVAVLLFVAARSRQAAWRRVMSGPLMTIMLPESRSRKVPASVLGLAGLTLLILAAADPRWGRTTREVPQRGIEVVFLLDVSRSMLAEDVSPNRLERAKQQIKDMIDEMSGDRIGLVAFAGESRQVVPMTSHYDDFKQQLDELSPTTLRRGGSKLGDAITVAGEAFLDKTADHKAIVILTDGEDQESNPEQRARSIFQQTGARIFAIGLGDELRGATIPDTDADNPRRRTEAVVRYEGETVISKMNGDILRSIAEATGGAYIPAGTKRVNMADVYYGYVASVAQREFDSATIDVLTPRFQWFAIPALVCLLAEIFLSRPAVRSAAMVMLLVTNVAIADDRSVYNAAIASEESGQREAAIDQFTSVASSANPQVAAHSRANLGNLRMKSAADLVQSDRPAAIALLQAAMTNYRDALQLDPSRDDWRGKIELAARWIDELQQQETKDDSKEPEPSPNEKPEENDEPKPDGDEPSDEKSDDSQESEPQDSGNEDEPDSSESGDGQPQPSQPEPTENTKPSDSPSEQPAEEPPADEPTADEPTAEDGEPNNEARLEPNDLDESPPSETPKPSETKTQPGQLSEEEALKMLQSVRDREMVRRYLQQQRNQRRQLSVDKDW